MSHHSVESMRDVAFRKGRHGFSSDDDYLRALRGEELEDGFLDEEDGPLGDKGDETLDEAVAGFEDIVFEAVVESSSKTVNTVFDWIMEAEAGRSPGTLTFVHNGTTVRMSVAGEDLDFGAIGNGADIRGRCGFEDFLTDVQDMLMEDGSPCCAACDIVRSGLYAARQYECGYEDLWRRDIAKFMADRGGVSTAYLSHLDLCVDKPGEGTRMHTCLVRLPLLPDGDTLWVLPNPANLEDVPEGTPPEDMLLEDEDGHPTRLLQWLFGRDPRINIPSRPEG